MQPLPEKPQAINVADCVRVSQRHVNEFKSLWLTNGRPCGICGRPFTKDDYAVVDHDHTTGVIRGCLHNTCNRAEGEMVSCLKRMYGVHWLRKACDVANVLMYGGQLSPVLKRIARYTHKGVSTGLWFVGLTRYLDYYSEPRTRMIHPSHRFECEGGNVKKPNPRFKKWRRK